MKTSDFYYDLPKELIAQDPLEDRSSSRLLHLSMEDGSFEHRHFTDILDYLKEGDCLLSLIYALVPSRKIPASQSAAHNSILRRYPVICPAEKDRFFHSLFEQL